MEKVNINIAAEKLPYFIYGNISMNASTNYFLNTLPNNYGYLLKKVVCSYPDVNSAVTAFNNPLYIEFFDTASYKARQTNRIPLELISTYCNNKIRVAIPAAPADYPVGELKSVINLNFFYPYSDIINIQLSGVNPNVPANVDILLMGYFIKREEGFQ